MTVDAQYENANGVGLFGSVLHNQIRGVRNLIRELGKSKTVLVSTHILQEVEPVADRVLFIHDGKLVFDGKPAEMRAEGRTLEDQFHRLTAQPV